MGRGNQAGQAGQGVVRGRGERLGIRQVATAGGKEWHAVARGNWSGKQNRKRRQAGEQSISTHAYWMLPVGLLGLAVICGTLPVREFDHYYQYNLL